MSLLLKALKQAESSTPARSGTDKADATQAAGRIEDDFELEPLGAGTAQAREWVEPPGLLFGSNGVSPEGQRKPAFRWPQLSLVPLTALLAAGVALGYGVYLYFALKPPAAAVATPASNVTAPPTPAPASSTLHLDPAPVPMAAAGNAAVAMPDARPAATPAASPSTPTGAAPAAADRIAPLAQTPPAAPTAAPAMPQFHPDGQTGLLTRAYAAYQRGALAEARQLYSQVAARGRNVDALLGLAAIASVQHRDADAQRLYRDVLDIDPRNPVAQGALLDLLGNTDDQATESRLKSLIDRDPSPQLYQALGNLYAGEARWNEAQAAYFEAYRGAPDNADYAFNLAVSLDQLRQYPAALNYYEKAIAGGSVHRFDQAQAQARVAQLKALH